MSCLTTGTEYWDEHHLAPVDVEEALKLPLFEGLGDRVEIEERMWHSRLKVDGYSSGKEAIKAMYEDQIGAKEKSALIITLFPDKSFTILIDEAGNQLLVDTHIHYLDENQSFDQAVKVADCRGFK